MSLTKIICTVVKNAEAINRVQSKLGVTHEQAAVIREKIYEIHHGFKKSGTVTLIYPGMIGKEGSLWCTTCPADKAAGAFEKDAMQLDKTDVIILDDSGHPVEKIPFNRSIPTVMARIHKICSWIYVEA